MTPSVPGDGDNAARTDGQEYTDRLVTLEGKRWKQVLDVQRPYRRNLQRMELGRVLDVGCGIGRNLGHLSSDSVGVDHNPTSVETCRARGLRAYTSQELPSSPEAQQGPFDALLMAHLLEHVDVETEASIFDEYLPYLRPGGRVVVITPQERGYASDATHIRWVDHAVVRDRFLAHGLAPIEFRSFPFPRQLGKAFIYNEFISVGRLVGS